ncbi:hypothetical protein [Runella zeae]|uniref:hypothetical protein n=1 Tax=Runella zeae TaxID=94255 RepID=UPI0004079143|nr:hypothetical protein [Runella zeae]
MEKAETNVKTLKGRYNELEISCREKWLELQSDLVRLEMLEYFKRTLLVKPHYNLRKVDAAVAVLMKKYLGYTDDNFLNNNHILS